MCPCVCLFTFWGTIKTFFLPYFQSLIYKNFWDLESLGKSNEKKWSKIWRLLQINGVKLGSNKKMEKQEQNSLPAPLVAATAAGGGGGGGLSPKKFFWAPKKTSCTKKKVFGATIRIGQMIQCLQFAGPWCDPESKCSKMYGARSNEMNLGVK